MLERYIWSQPVALNYERHVVRYGVKESFAFRAPAGDKTPKKPVQLAALAEGVNATVPILGI